jgi:uncharacterized membrane protein
VAVTTDFETSALAQKLRAALRLLTRPVVAFVLASGIFGSSIAIITPPLRGPDEAAHFLRAYGIARGQIIPSSVDEQGRKGIWLPAEVQRDFAFFEEARYKVREENVSYSDFFSNYRHRPQLQSTDGPPVFELYSGSEGYTPIPYLPYVLAALLARAADLNFLSTLYLMRFVGLATLTAAAAWAIATMPYLRWAFVCIAMLPAALYARAVVSADGMALVSAMMVAALCVRSTRREDAPPLLRQAVWMALCVLSKPPQIAFTLFSIIRRPFRELPRDWRPLALIVLPGCIVAFVWFALTGGDVAAWRMADDSHGIEQFGVGWKLGFMIAHPLHFPRVALTNFRDSLELWKQLIGVLAWLDSPLQPWVYPILSATLLVTFIEPTDASPPVRRRILAMAVATIFCYWLALTLIFFLVWTPIESPDVSGLQGRYFIVVLPFLAIAVAAALSRGLNEKTRAAVALLTVLLSWSASIEAILRTDWKF